MFSQSAGKSDVWTAHVNNAIQNSWHYCTVSWLLYFTGMSPVYEERHARRRFAVFLILEAFTLTLTISTWNCRPCNDFSVFQFLEDSFRTLLSVLRLTFLGHWDLGIGSCCECPHTVEWMTWTSFDTLNTLADIGCCNFLKDAEILSSSP